MRNYSPSQTRRFVSKPNKRYLLNYEVKDYPNICRDPKDNFLLGLIRIGKPHYLVTGDKDLLELNPFEETQIITPADFQQIVLDEVADG